MEKLSTKSFFILILLHLIFWEAGDLRATKLARLSIDELKKQASTVVILEISETKKTNELYDQVHTEVKGNWIQHKAKVLDLIKGNSKMKEMTFFNIKGLITGKKYLVFLSKTENDRFTVSDNGYGALRIGIIPMKSKIIEAVRVPDSFIALPKGFSFESGVTAKDEVSSFVWVDFKDLSDYLR